jgi:hypothetical protein
MKKAIKKYQKGGNIVQSKSPRIGSRKNKDGSESTHLMTYTSADGKYYVYPTLFQKPDSTWYELSDDNNWAAFEEAKRLGEVYEFDTEEEAKKFAAGSWKNPPKMQKGGKTKLIDEEINLYNEYKKYVNSDTYLNRLSNFRNLEEAKLEQLISLDRLNNASSPTISPFNLPKNIQGWYEGSNILNGIGNIMLSPNRDNYTYVHEMDHLNRSGGDRYNNAELSLLRGMNRSDSKLSKDQLDYLQDPRESGAKLSNLRSAAVELGIHQEFGEEFSEEQLQNLIEKVKENKSFKFIEAYNPEYLLQALNTIADREERQAVPIAQYGGSPQNNTMKENKISKGLNKYQHGGKNDRDILAESLEALNIPQKELMNILFGERKSPSELLTGDELGSKLMGRENYGLLADLLLDPLNLIPLSKTKYLLGFKGEKQKQKLSNLSKIGNALWAADKVNDIQTATTSDAVYPYTQSFLKPFQQGGNIQNNTMKKNSLKNKKLNNTYQLGGLLDNFPGFNMFNDMNKQWNSFWRGGDYFNQGTQGPYNYDPQNPTTNQPIGQSKLMETINTNRGVVDYYNQSKTNLDNFYKNSTIIKDSKLGEKAWESYGQNISNGVFNTGSGLGAEMLGYQTANTNVQNSQKQLSNAFSNTASGIFSGMNYLNSYTPPEKINKVKGFQGVQYAQNGAVVGNEPAYNTFDAYKNHLSNTYDFNDPQQKAYVAAMLANYKKPGAQEDSPYGKAVVTAQVAPQATAEVAAKKTNATAAKPNKTKEYEPTSDGVIKASANNKDPWEYKPDGKGGWLARDTSRNTDWFQASGKALTAIQNKFGKSTLNNTNVTTTPDSKTPWNHSFSPVNSFGLNPNNILSPSILNTNYQLESQPIANNYLKWRGIDNIQELKPGQSLLDYAAPQGFHPLELLGGLQSGAAISGSILNKGIPYIKEATKNFFKKGLSPEVQEAAKLFSPKTADLAKGLTRLPNGRIAKITDTRGGLQKITDSFKKYTPDIKGAIDASIKSGKKLTKDIYNKLSPKDKVTYDELFQQNLNTIKPVKPTLVTSKNANARSWQKYQEGGNVNPMGYTPGFDSMYNRSNEIPGGDITMGNTPIALLGIGKGGADHGLIKLMDPGVPAYQFNSKSTVEIPRASMGGYLRKYQHGGLIHNPNNAYNTPILPYLSEELGFQELQAEDKEVIFLPDGTIAEVKADKKHKNMHKHKVTDVGPNGSYIFSADKKMKFSPNSSINGVKLKDMKLGKTAFEYKENEITPGPEDIMISDVLFKNNKEITTADMARNIKKKFQLTDLKDDPFASKANEENKSQRLEYLEILKAFNEYKKPKPRGSVAKAQYGMPLQPTNNGFDGMMNYMNKAMDPLKRMDNNLVSMFNIPQPNIPKIPKMYNMGGDIPHAGLGDLVYWGTPFGWISEAIGHRAKKKQERENKKLLAEHMGYANRLQKDVDLSGGLNVLGTGASYAASLNAPLARYNDNSQQISTYSDSFNRQQKMLDAAKYSANSGLGAASSLARYSGTPNLLGRHLADATAANTTMVGNFTSQLADLEARRASTIAPLLGNAVDNRNAALNARANQLYNANIQGLSNLGSATSTAVLNSGNTRYELGNAKMAYEDVLRDRARAARDRVRAEGKGIAGGVADLGMIYLSGGFDKLGKGAGNNPLSQSSANVNGAMSQMGASALSNNIASRSIVPPSLMQVPALNYRHSGPPLLPPPDISGFPIPYGDFIFGTQSRTQQVPSNQTFSYPMLPQSQIGQLYSQNKSIYNPRFSGNLPMINTPWFY